jgi:hypothetical protein
MRFRSLASVTEWLLQPENPSVRYFTLRDIFDRMGGTEEMKAARCKIITSKIVKGILAKQNPRGYWCDPDIPYLPKYKASFWQVILMGYLGLTRTHERIEAACEFIFRFQHPEGGFSPTTEKTARHDYDWHVKRGRILPPFDDLWLAKRVKEDQMPCLTGNMIAALVRLGYHDDPRVKHAVQWLAAQQNPDGGWLCYRHKTTRGAVHSCFYGSICPLEGLSEYIRYDHSMSVLEISRSAAEFFLMHRLYKADHHDFSIINKRWLMSSFPWFYNYSVLRGLDVVTSLGYVHDGRLNDAVDVVLRKQRDDGTWMLESTPTGRMYGNVGVKGKPNKWITLFALRVSRRLGLCHI